MLKIVVCNKKYYIDVLLFFVDIKILFFLFVLCTQHTLSYNFFLRFSSFPVHTYGAASALLYTKFLYYTFFSLSAWYNNIVCYDRIINELLVITLTSIRTNKYVFLYLKEEKRKKVFLLHHSSNFYYVKITNFWVNKKKSFLGKRSKNYSHQIDRCREKDFLGIDSEK